jgi:hypothetical protein
MQKLFTAESIVRVYRGYRNVRFYWFVEEREESESPDIPPELCMNREVIDELFTEEEIKLLEEYLNRVHDLKMEIHEIDLPIPPDGIPRGELAEGDSDTDGYYYLSQELGYDLPFAVSAYYNLEDTEDYQQLQKLMVMDDKKRVEEIPIDDLRSMAINDPILRERVIEILESSYLRSVFLEERD